MDPGINDRPGLGCAIDPEEISAPRHLVYWPIRFCEKIAIFDRRVGRNLAESLTNSTRGTVMPFAKASGKNENFFHDGNGAGSLMDNCAGQSTLGRHEPVAAGRTHHAPD